VLIRGSGDCLTLGGKDKPFVTQIASIFRVEARDECTLHVKVFLDFSIILQNLSNNNSSIKGR